MRLELTLIYLFIFFFSVSSFAVDARAQWLNSHEIKIKLPLGLYVNPTNTQFALSANNQSPSENSLIYLPLKYKNTDYAKVDTAHLTKEQISQLIRQPLSFLILNNHQQILDSTSIQYSGVLDELFAYAGDDLGGRCSNSSCTAKLWAPTAIDVKLLTYSSTRSSAPTTVFQMERSSEGVWIYESLPPSVLSAYYAYQVQVFHPLSQKIEVFQVTDPYSFSLSTNGQYSQFVDLHSSELMPSGWSQLRKPALQNLRRAVIYELHLRDFSSQDESIPFPYRGGYLAFTQKQANSVRHIAALAEAGLTHIHLLPFNDFGSVNEEKSQWENYSGETIDLQEPQSIVGGIRSSDPYNWGYDPVHYFAPEGSYATGAEGSRRIHEARQMIQALNELGLRVVQDVVFNHTYQDGFDKHSIFDKVVPLYYYRLDDYGRPYKSSCCPDTASENRMMEKLMVDAVLHWAKIYKVDGFRFDLMSFHSIHTMAKIREALRSLTLEKDGVDGSNIILYGEGWSFGSFHDRAPQDSMSMENVFGQGYGVFNDRLRDAARGGTTNSHEKSDQGFVTGLYFDFNHEPANRNTPADPEAQRLRLLHYADVVKVGLAGNLRDFYFREHLGHWISAGSLNFRGAPVGFSAEAMETVNYTSAHDGYGIWDTIQAKAPFYSHGREPATASLEDRQRMQQLLLAIPLLSQGIPFIEAGSELLRSKNGDQDSYDSGDFFNRVDWTGQQNYWGTGLPPAWKNLNDWSFWLPRLQDPQLRPHSHHIQQTRDYFISLLRLRQSSSLFQLNSLQEISSKLSFVDNETFPTLGLIAMHLRDDDEQLLILFNISPEALKFSHPLLSDTWILHPLLDGSVDPHLGEATIDQVTETVLIPSRSTLVLQKRTSGHTEK